jgi:ABC-type transport system involved in multi-copper enzyme maturation permease subunit
MSTTTETMRPAAQVFRESTHGLRFGGTVGAEFHKIIRLRSSQILFCIGVLGFVGVMLLLTLGTTLSKIMVHAPEEGVGIFQDVLYLLFTVGAGIFLLLTSAVLVGMEYSQGTLRILLARGTGRLSLLAAKLLALFGVGVALLAAFTAASLVWIGLVTVHWTGSLSALTGTGPEAAKHLGLGLLLALLSVFCTVVIGSTMATLGRSVAFGVGMAMVLFPADNFGAVILGLVSQLTNQKFWADVTAYLFGPNLNALPGLAIKGLRVPHVLPEPYVSVTLTHALVVIGIWALGLLALEAVLTWRRDVLA